MREPGQHTLLGTPDRVLAPCHLIPIQVETRGKGPPWHLAKDILEVLTAIDPSLKEIAKELKSTRQMMQSPLS